LCLSLCDTLKTFEHLTSFSLSWNADWRTDFLHFFTALAEVKLTSLQLDIPFKLEDLLLALVLGKKRDLIPE